MLIFWLFENKLVVFTLDVPKHGDPYHLLDVCTLAHHLLYSLKDAILQQFIDKNACEVDP
jgi:hypothetical protein